MTCQGTGCTVYRLFTELLTSEICCATGPPPQREMPLCKPLSRRLEALHHISQGCNDCNVHVQSQMPAGAMAMEWDGTCMGCKLLSMLRRHRT